MMDECCRWARRALGIGCLTLTLTLALGAPASAQAQAAASCGKNAWLDMQTVLKQDPKYAEAEGAYNKEMKGYNDEIEKLQKQFDSTVTDYQQKQVVLSPSARTAKETDLRGLQTKIQTRMSELQTKATQRERELIGPIEDRVRTVIDGIRAERSFCLIFDAGRAGILSMDPTLDITAMVVQRLKPAGQ